MAKNTEIFFTKEGHVAQVKSVTSITTLATVGADGAKLFNIYMPVGITGSVTLYIKESGGTDVDVFNIQDPDPNVNLLDNGVDVFPKDKNGNIFMNIPGNSEIRVSSNVATDFRCYYENY